MHLLSELCSTCFLVIQYSNKNAVGATEAQRKPSGGSFGGKVNKSAPPKFDNATAPKKNDAAASKFSDSTTPTDTRVTVEAPPESFSDYEKVESCTHSYTSVWYTYPDPPSKCRTCYAYR